MSILQLEPFSGLLGAAKWGDMAQNGEKRAEMANFTDGKSIVGRMSNSNSRKTKETF